MASTHAKAVRRAAALQRLSGTLGVQPADLHANARGDSELALIMTLERIADALDTNQQAQQRGDLRSTILAASDDELIAIPGIGEKSLAQVRAWAQEQPAETPQQPQDAPEGDDSTGAPLTVETVTERPLETIETVQIVEPDAAPQADAPKPKGKAK